MMFPDDVKRRFFKSYEFEMWGSRVCWVWRKARDRYGYGQFTANGKNLRAHRVSWQISEERELVASEKLDHICNNRACVNPAHLRILTQRENVLRSATNPLAVNARKTHCVRGHEFTVHNTMRDVRPGHEGRICKKCRSGAVN